MPANTSPETNEGMESILAAELPVFAAEQAERVLLELYGISGQAKRIAGERDLNFLVDAADGCRYVLKISNQEEGDEALEFQNAALMHLAQVAPALPVPRVLPNRTGATISPVSQGGRSYQARLLAYLPGETCINVSPTPVMRRSIGKTLAQLDRALRGFFHAAAGQRVIWDLQHAASLRSKIDYLATEPQRELARRVLDDFDANVAPMLPRLRRQVIYNDLNQNNLLLEPASGTVSGIIDFGDMVHSCLVNDLAIAVAHQLYRQCDPLPAAVDVIEGYVAVNPLEREEAAVLLDLVRMRLLSRELIAAWRVEANPAAPCYHAETSRMGWEALERLQQLDRAKAQREIFAAAGLPLPRLPAGSEAEYSKQMSDLIVRRNRLLGPTYKQFYQTPFFPEKGDGVWLTDIRGQRFLDGYNNVPHVGHCHPHVSAAVTRQVWSLNTNTRYLHDTILDYAEKLTSTMPDPLKVCLFVCSGTEANELAWRIAMANSGGDGAIVTRSAFHGNSTVIGALDSSTIPHDKLQPWVATVPAPDIPGSRPDRPVLSAEAYAEYYDTAISELAERGHQPAAFFACPVFASDGLYSAPAGYLAPAMAKLKAAGAVIVADEVQSGLGRTGTHMWGFQHAGFTPDIVTTGKPMGNGLPLAVVITSQAMLERFVETERYFNTFGGNPVVCAAGLAVLEVMEREQLQQNALQVGTYLREGLAGLMARHELIGDVRGTGFFAGVELVRDRTANTPAPTETRAVIEGLLARGVLVGITGAGRNLLKIRPPMCFSRANADQLVAALDDTLSTLSIKP